MECAHRDADLSVLIDEYRTLIGEASILGRLDQPGLSRDRLRAMLVGEADWTLHAADTLCDLVEQYGAFILRNASALALALGVEDGERGL